MTHIPLRTEQFRAESIGFYSCATVPASLCAEIEVEAEKLRVENARLRAVCLAALPFVLDGQLVSHQNSPRDPRQVSRESVAVNIRQVTGGAAC